MKAMERIAPVRLAESWDNVGLLLESPFQKKGKKILLTIDLTSSVLEESLKRDASIIVSYHPTIFHGLKSLTLADPIQTSLLKCAAHGISVYSPHTALDSVWGGINDWLAEGLMGGKDKGEIRSLLREKLNPTTGGSEGGECRLVTLKEPIGIDVLEKRIKSHLNLSQIMVGYPLQTQSRTSPVRSIAICAGSGGSALSGQEADVYFTGEMQHHEVLAAVARGKHVILCGHTNTERGYLPVLAEKLKTEFASQDFGDQDVGDIEVVISQEDKHPLQFV
jgi:dinuclear metal center YbgI/SA1388 family protein